MGDEEVNSVQFNSVTQWCLTLCDPMNHSTPGLPVHHQLPEFMLATHKLHKNYTKEIIEVFRKFQDPQQTSHTGELAKRQRTPSKFDYGGHWDLIIELPQDWRNRLLEGTNKTLYTQEAGERSSVPTRD